MITPMGAVADRVPSTSNEERSTSSPGRRSPDLPAYEIRFITARSTGDVVDRPGEVTSAGRVCGFGLSTMDSAATGDGTIPGPGRAVVVVTASRRLTSDVTAPVGRVATNAVAPEGRPVSRLPRSRDGPVNARP